MTQQQAAEWVKMTCLAFGSSVYTAYTVAGLFVKGLDLPDERDEATRTQIERQFEQAKAEITAPGQASESSQANTTWAI